MDVGRSFTYMFEDKDWIAKLAIGGVILLTGTILFWLVIPIIAAYAVVLGYSLVALRNVYDGSPTPLPEWNNFGDLFVKGITAIVGVLIWSIPVLILLCCIFLTTFAIGGTARGDNGSAAATFGGLVVTCLTCLTVIVGIIISVVTYAPLTNFALTNQISTFWDFSGNWRFIQQNAGNYVIAFLLAYVANLIAGFGLIACIVGVFFTSFWAMLVISHLFGQVARGNMAPTDTDMLPPAPPPMDQPPPPMTPGPMEPAPTA